MNGSKINPSKFSYKLRTNFYILLFETENISLYCVYMMTSIKYKNPYNYFFNSCL